MLCRRGPGRHLEQGNSEEERADAVVRDRKHRSAAAWWRRLEPPAVESLWAFTLKSALPHPESQLWDPVPDLPLPSAAKSTSLKLEDDRWCDPCSDVDPFPDTSPPSPPSPRTPEPPSLSCSQQDLLVRTRPAPKPADRRSATHSRPSPDHQTAAPQHVLSKTQQTEEEKEEEAAAAGQTCVGGKQKEETAAVSRQLRPECSGPPGEEKGPRRAGGDGGDGGDGGAGGAGGAGGDGGAGLQRCPMCLQVFPAGFTQMDCDGHLAQCLSDMNVDMTW
ncbi:translation initiation factor IF-2 isoform X2 [Melanotaenia boesemani]|uniref:translation initiation factor IF-2 isoform X2 n=1 Tax=Melanotaenia boesemani TaxID=1250792 RepID=UPI001C03EA94|nr:translation initiation factor IF-2 isoform X2 [Melanotaenia boesemani]